MGISFPHKSRHSCLNDDFAPAYTKEGDCLTTEVAWRQACDRMSVAVAPLSAYCNYHVLENAYQKNYYRTQAQL